MRIVRAESFTELVSAIEDAGAVHFRGVPRVSFELVPKIGRSIAECGPEFLRIERLMISRFRREAVGRVSQKPESLWEWLALAQHHGMATRLLDWTGNPLVAAWFACRQEPEFDGGVYCDSALGTINFEDHPDPLAVTETAAVVPPHVTPRITAQAGLFTVHAVPNEPLQLERGTKIVIPSTRKDHMLGRLRTYGIQSSTLFPDLDGLATDIQSEFETLQQIGNAIARSRRSS